MLTSKGSSSNSTGSEAITGTQQYEDLLRGDIPLPSLVSETLFFTLSLERKFIFHPDPNGRLGERGGSEI